MDAIPDRLTIDRFEGDFAVCEGAERGLYDLPRAALPPDAREGDRLRRVDGVWTVDRDGAEERRAALRRRMERLWD